VAYSPTTWADRVSGIPGQFSATGAVTGNVTLALNDSPSVAGTAVTAARMNNIENELVALDGGSITGAIRTVGLTGATAAARYVGATTTGSPTSGTFAVGDFVIAQNGIIWVCTGAGTPGTWTKVGVPTKQVFTSSGTFTAPFAGTYKVICTGGGGAGGYSTAAGITNGGSGGAAGGTAIKWAVLTLNQAVTVTIGAGGTQPGPSPKAGNPGGTSSFGAICSATGGGGGGYGAAIYYAISANGGTGSGGDINLTGSPSQQETADYNAAPVMTIGAPSYWGYSYGSGGDGYSSQAGKAGIIVVEWVG
jgi:hypothetical protein